MEGDREDGRFPALACGFCKEWAGQKGDKPPEAGVGGKLTWQPGRIKAGTVLRAVPPEVSQDHPWAAPITPGSSRYLQMKWSGPEEKEVFPGREEVPERQENLRRKRKLWQKGWNRVEDTSLAIFCDIAGDFLYVDFMYRFCVWVLCMDLVQNDTEPEAPRRELAAEGFLPDERG